MFTQQELKDKFGQHISFTDENLKGLLFKINTKDRSIKISNEMFKMSSALQEDLVGHLTIFVNKLARL